VAEREALVWTLVQKIVGNDFSRPTGARRVRRREAPHKSLLQSAMRSRDGRGCFYMWRRERLWFGPLFKKSSGTIFHDRREPAGQGAGKRRVQIRRERICMTEGSPEGEAQGCAA